MLCKSAKILSGVGITVSLVTNGSLLTKEKAERLVENGVTRPQVSLDGAREETHERLRQYKGAFKLAISAISYFAQTKGYEEIMVAFTPTGFNYTELEDTFYLTRDLGVEQFRVQPLMILGSTQLHLKELLPNPLQYRHIVRTIIKLQDKFGPNTIEWGDPVDHLIRFRTRIQHCINNVNIQANGDIVPSPYLPISVGNIRRHSFKKYWDAGLVKIWELPVIQRMAERICSVPDFGRKEEGIPTVWFEKNIEIDIIDNKEVFW
ncbi:MAG: radical SAM protein [bacterium]